MWDPYAEFQSTVLPNGLTIHCAHWPERPWQTIGFMIHSGAEQDQPGSEGTAHFTEHLVCNNASIPRNSLESFFKESGGGVGLGSTKYHYTNWSFFVPANAEILSQAFSIFGYMLLDAKLEKFIERHRHIIKSEFNDSYPTQVQLDIDWRQCKALYSGTFLERFVSELGTLESIERIGQNNLQTYYDTHYNPSNMSVVSVGSMEPSELIELISQSPFGMNKAGVRTAIPIPFSEISPPTENRYVFEISKHVRMNTPAKAGGYSSKAKIPAIINGWVIRILRQMFQEILFEEIREEREWTYNINSNWNYRRHFFEFSIICSSLTIEALDKIEEVIETCITSMYDRTNLFEKIKRRELAGNYMIDPSGSNIRDGAIKDLGSYHRIISLYEDEGDIRKITMADIHTALHYLRPEMRWTVIAKP